MSILNVYTFTYVYIYIYNLLCVYPGSYLHIQPATLESLTRSAANANANRTRRKNQSQQQEGSIKEETPADALKEMPQNENLKNLRNDDVKKDDNALTVSVLPPALKGLVLIWEELSHTCRRAVDQQILLPSPSFPSKVTRNNTLNREKTTMDVKDETGKGKVEGKKSSRKKKEWKTAGKLNVLEEANGLAASFLSAAADKEGYCELCGGTYPHPVTYHMRQAHPGCGGHAGGKGYNSSGNFCVGWAGHCGDGGVGGSSWYLVCDTCRDKYIQAKKDENFPTKERKKSSGKKKSAIIHPGNNASQMLSPSFCHNSSDSHLIMRANAMFLLDLASAGIEV